MLNKNCECESNKNFFEVKTNKAIYKFQFSEVQFEITGVCNMNCIHCRGAYDEKVDLPIEQIKKVMRFVRKYSPTFKEVTLSGGEPFLHKQFKEILLQMKKENVSYLTLTTNGSKIDKEIIEYIKELNFERVTFSVSLDSIDREKHNAFRNNDKAYDYALSAFDLLKKYGDESFYVSLRATIKPNGIEDMDDFVKFAIEHCLDRVSFSSVLPSGKAINSPELLMDAKQIRKFCDKVQELYLKYNHFIDISSNEPLKWQSRGQRPKFEEGKMLLDACPAGTISFNINSNGDMTPCSLMNLKMMNIMDLTEEEIEENYKNNEIVKNLFDRNLNGKCGSCLYRCNCAGCRARALSLTGDYLNEDVNCYLGPF